MIDKKTHNLIVEKAHKLKVDHTSNTNKIAHVPARVNYSSVPVTDTTIVAVLSLDVHY